MAMKLIEIGIILILLVMIFGIVLSNVEDSTQKVIKAQEINNMEKLTSEVLDNLINNPGVPENWNECREGTPGLAITNEAGLIIPNSVSYSKLIALGKDYDKLVYEQMFSSKIHSSLELRPHESSIASVKLGDYEEGDNIYSLTRLVKCDFYKHYVLKDFKNDGKCNKQHSQSEYSCNYFKIFPGNLRKSDYYLLIDDSEKYDLEYIVETTRMVKDPSWQTPDSNKIYLNDLINFYDDDNAVVFIHLNKPNPKAVLISVPNDFDEGFLEYDYFRTNECELIMRAWY